MLPEMDGKPVFGVTSGHTGYGQRLWSVSVVAAAGVDEAAARRRKPRERSLAVAGAMACSWFLGFALQ